VRANLLNLTEGWPEVPTLAGLPGGAAAWAIAACIDGPTLVVVATPAEATRLSGEIQFHLDGAAPVTVLPPDDVRPFDGLSPQPEVTRARIRATLMLHSDQPCVVVASAQGLLHKVHTLPTLESLTHVLRAGMTIDRDQLVQSLVLHGYHGVVRVMERGTMSSRGAVIDIWPTTSEVPFRVDLFDDEIEEIRPLDPSSQKSGTPIPSIEVPPAREAVATTEALSRLSQHTAEMVDKMGGGQPTRRTVIQDLRQGLWFPAAEDYLAAMYPLVDPWRLVDRLIVVDPEDVAHRVAAFAGSVIDRWEGRSLVDRPPVDTGARFGDLGEVQSALSKGQSLTPIALDEAPDYSAQSNESMFVGKGELAPIVGRIHSWLEEGWRVALVAESHTRAERLSALLGPHGLNPVAMARGSFGRAGTVALWIGALDRGFHCAPAQLAIITSSELFGAKKKRTAVRKTLKEATLGSVNELKVGDLVVHIRHGVGRFERLKRIDLNGNEQEFAEVEYRGGDKMFLPVTRLDELYRYRTMGDRTPRLDKLGGDSWEKRKNKVKDRVLRMAHELLEMHAVREVSTAHSYVGEPPLFQQFVETFPYTETPDQAAAIDEVMENLTETTPMDRLVVGDVGFGKTEVAMRAAMRVVLEGHQVTLLCPTTVLAFQHQQTFQKRFSDTGIRVEFLAGYRTADERRKILMDTAEGKVDIVIGTTSLLTRDLRFKHLGLVIVDEEHRFGVRQKHKLKQITSAQPTGPVHYLAMSATPIPRTLHMALSGLRKVSLITTPPPARLAIQTRLTKFNDDRIREDVLAELGRGGQVFFVHNRVASIEAMATHLRELIPEAKICVAHGQMDKRHLERVLLGFIQREFHMLVCSTIIESGVDIPSVNTMIVNRADELGMAQLYQLRGRVGRSHVRARCTLMIPADEPINPTARVRLRALQEHSDLGSGFAIATRDMEVRGSGTLLGEAQHGHIEAVGFDTYVELLEEAIAIARGDMTLKRLDPEIEIPVPMLIPEDWMPELQDRLTAYRELAMGRSTDQVRAVLSDWEDRFGEPPPEVLNLGWAAEAKVRARHLGIAHIRWHKVRVDLDFDSSSPVPRETIVALVSQDGQRFRLAPIPSQESTEAGRLVVRFTPAEGQWPFRFLHWLFRQLEGSLET
jgi:transcription-repair coupling factor (superfamily II helicase)